MWVIGTQTTCTTVTAFKTAAIFTVTTTYLTCHFFLCMLVLPLVLVQMILNLLIQIASRILVLKSVSVLLISFYNQRIDWMIISTITFNGLILLIKLGFKFRGSWFGFLIFNNCFKLLRLFTSHISRAVFLHMQRHFPKVSVRLMSFPLWGSPVNHERSTSLFLL